MHSVVEWDPTRHFGPHRSHILETAMKWPVSFGQRRSHDGTRVDHGIVWSVCSVVQKHARVERLTRRLPPDVLMHPLCAQLIQRENSS